MIYVCIPSHNEAATIGLLLWKIRQVFAGFAREYHLLALDDGSTDATSEILEPYARVLPLTVIRHEQRQGYAASVEELLRQAVELTDRPKRDAAILLHADFTHNPQVIPDLVRRVESGADIVVAEGKLEGEPSRSYRLLRRYARIVAARNRDGSRRERCRLRVQHFPPRDAPQRAAQPSGPTAGHRRLGRQRRALLARQVGTRDGSRRSRRSNGMTSASGRAECAR